MNEPKDCEQDKGFIWETAAIFGAVDDYKAQLGVTDENVDWCKIRSNCTKEGVAADVDVRSRFEIVRAALHVNSLVDYIRYHGLSKEGKAAWVNRRRHTIQVREMESSQVDKGHSSGDQHNSTTEQTPCRFFSQENICDKQSLLADIQITGRYVSLTTLLSSPFHAYLGGIQRCSTYYFRTLVQEYIDSVMCKSEQEQSLSLSNGENVPDAVIIEQDMNILKSKFGSPFGRLRSSLEHGQTDQACAANGVFDYNSWCDMNADRGQSVGKRACKTKRRKIATTSITAKKGGRMLGGSQGRNLAGLLHARVSSRRHAEPARLDQVPAAKSNLTHLEEKHLLDVTLSDEQHGIVESPQSPSLVMEGNENIDCGIVSTENLVVNSAALASNSNLDDNEDTGIVIASSCENIRESQPASLDDETSPLNTLCLPQAKIGDISTVGVEVFYKRQKCIPEKASRLMNDFGSTHAGRRFNIEEWRVIFRYAKSHDQKLCVLSPNELKVLVTNAGITTGKGGEKLKSDLFSYALPNFDLVDVPGSGNFELKNVDRYSCMTIFHSITDVTGRHILAVIEQLISSNVLSAINHDKFSWFRHFVHSLYKGDEEMFNTCYYDFDKVRTELISEYFRLVCLGS